MKIEDDDIYTGLPDPDDATNWLEEEEKGYCCICDMATIEEECIICGNPLCVMCFSSLGGVCDEEHFEK